MSGSFVDTNILIYVLLDSAVHDAALTVAPIERGEQGDYEERARLD